MSDRYVHKLSDRWHPGATLLAPASSEGGPDDDWVGRFEITQASPGSPHFTAMTGVP